MAGIEPHRTKYQAYCKVYKSLVSAVKPLIGKLAGKLRTESPKNFVSESCLKEAENKASDLDTRVKSLLQHIKKKIGEEESHFDTFITVLESSHRLKPVAGLLLQSLRKSHTGPRSSTGELVDGEDTDSDSDTSLRKQNGYKGTASKPTTCKTTSKRRPLQPQHQQVVTHKQKERRVTTKASKTSTRPSRRTFSKHVVTANSTVLSKDSDSEAENSGPESIKSQNVSESTLDKGKELEDQTLSAATETDSESVESGRQHLESSKLAVVVQPENTHPLLCDSLTSTSLLLNDRDDKTQSVEVLKLDSAVTLPATARGHSDEDTTLMSPPMECEATSTSERMDDSQGARNASFNPFCTTDDNSQTGLESLPNDLDVTIVSKACPKKPAGQFHCEEVEPLNSDLGMNSNGQHHTLEQNHGTLGNTQSWNSNSESAVTGSNGPQAVPSAVGNEMMSQRETSHISNGTATQGTRLRTNTHYHDLYHFLVPYSHHWRAIGVALGFFPNELDLIQSNVMLLIQGPSGYLNEMITKWLQWAPGDGRGSRNFATYEDLFYALLLKVPDTASKAYDLGPALGIEGGNTILHPSQCHLSKGSGSALSAASHTVTDSTLTEPTRSTSLNSSTTDTTTESELETSRTDLQEKPATCFTCNCNSKGPCSLSDFLEGKCKGQLENQFPYLDVRGLTESQKKKVSKKLRKDTKSIMDKFRQLVTCVFDSLTTNQVPVEIVRRYAITFNDSQGTLEHNDARLNTLHEVTNVNDLCSRLVEYKFISFFNFSILQEIVTKHGTQSDKDKMDEYWTEFKRFCKRSVFEIPARTLQNNSPDSDEKFVVKVTNRWFSRSSQERTNTIFTLEDLKTVVDEIEDIIELSDGFIFACDVREGCVLITFGIISRVKVLPLTKQQIDCLFELHIEVRYQHSGKTRKRPGITQKRQLHVTVPKPLSPETKRAKIQNTMLMNDPRATNAETRTISDSPTTKLFILKETANVTATSMESSEVHFNESSDSTDTLGPAKMLVNEYKPSYNSNTLPSRSQIVPDCQPDCSGESVATLEKIKGVSPTPSHAVRVRLTSTCTVTVTFKGASNGGVRTVTNHDPLNILNTRESLNVTNQTSNVTLTALESSCTLPTNNSSISAAANTSTWELYRNQVELQMPPSVGTCTATLNTCVAAAVSPQQMAVTTCGETSRTPQYPTVTTENCQGIFVHPHCILSCSGAVNPVSQQIHVVISLSEVECSLNVIISQLLTLAIFYSDHRLINLIITKLMCIPQQRFLAASTQPPQPAVTCNPLEKSSKFCTRSFSAQCTREEDEPEPVEVMFYPTGVPLQPGAKCRRPQQLSVDHDHHKTRRWSRSGSKPRGDKSSVRFTSKQRKKRKDPDVVKSPIVDENNNIILVPETIQDESETESISSEVQEAEAQLEESVNDEDSVISLTTLSQVDLESLKDDNSNDAVNCTTPLSDVEHSREGQSSNGWGKSTIYSKGNDFKHGTSIKWTSHNIGSSDQSPTKDTATPPSKLPLQGIRKPLKSEEDTLSTYNSPITSNVASPTSEYSSQDTVIEKFVSSLNFVPTTQSLTAPSLKQVQTNTYNFTEGYREKEILTSAHQVQPDVCSSDEETRLSPLQLLKPDKFVLPTGTRKPKDKYGHVERKRKPQTKEIKPKQQEDEELEKELQSDVKKKNNQKLMIAYQVPTTKQNMDLYTFLMAYEENEVYGPFKIISALLRISVIQFIGKKLRRTNVKQGLLDGTISQSDKEVKQLLQELEDFLDELDSKSGLMKHNQSIIQFEVFQLDSPQCNTALYIAASDEEQSMTSFDFIHPDLDHFKFGEGIDFKQISQFFEELHLDHHLVNKYSYKTDEKSRHEKKALLQTEGLCGR